MISASVGDGAPLDGISRYVARDYAFAFDVTRTSDLHERLGQGAFTSLAVGTLQVEVGVATGLALFVWGLHPRHTWVPHPVEVPRARSGTVRFDTAELHAAVSVHVADVGEWTTWYDADQGTVRVAVAPEAADEAEILIATNTVLGITGSTLSSIWLRPRFEE